jgi:hypothetical protein
VNAIERTATSAERAERIARYVLEHVRARSPYTWRQAPRAPGVSVANELEADAPHLALFRAFHIEGISELATGGLALVARGFPVLVTEAAILPEELLALQARGARCVTLVPNGAPAPAPHDDGLDFVLHDLCHLAKFADAEHYTAQVGLFATLARAFAAPGWRSTESRLDATWSADRAAVSADMNGSCVYLLAVLKMRLKMAARRSLARSHGVEAPSAGAATPEEEREFAELFAALLDAMALPDVVRAAAVTTNTRRDDPGAARVLLAHFDEAGRRALSDYA